MVSTDNNYRSVIALEATRLVEQVANRFVLNLYSRIQAIEALTRTIGATAEQITSQPQMQQIIPALLDFQGDMHVAGGGVWPEPYLLDASLERCSCFWGRDAAGNLVFFDDYNRSVEGYHHQSWYSVGRFAARGQCIWSASYLDPYSREPMITCTTPLFRQGQFAGVVTVDLKLDGLQTMADIWRDRTGGYLFIVDWSNRFITLPDRTLSNLLNDRADHSCQKSLLASELAQQQPLFAPVAIALDAMNQAILEQGKTMPNYHPGMGIALSQNSDYSREDAELVAAMMADPLGDEIRMNFHYQRLEVERDFWLQEEATVFLFHVPGTYWKVGVVKPFSEAATAIYSLVQAEKMSSLGQLVGGMAHEINNPVNFIYGNLNYATTYIDELLELLRRYQQHHPTPHPEVQAYLQSIDFAFLQEDLPRLLTSMKVGADRIRQLVLSLRNFARLDESALKSADLHEGLDNTLILLDGRLRSRDGSPGVKVVREYGDLPLILCYPGALNQVFMNLLLNALDAIDDALAAGTQTAPPQICIRTESLADAVEISITDNGPGIPKAIQPRLFDPFFTTKPVGKGTGLGLAISYQIVTENHHGELRCFSAVGQGASFQIRLPVSSPLTQRKFDSGI